VKNDIGYNVWKIQPKSKTNCNAMLEYNEKNLKHNANRMQHKFLKNYKFKMLDKFETKCKVDLKHDLNSARNNENRMQECKTNTTLV